MPRIHLRPDLARNHRPRTLPPARNRQPAASTAGKAGAPDPRRPAPGGVHHCRCPGFAVILWRRGQADCRPLGAAARFNANIAAGKSAVSRAARAIYRSSGRGGGSQQRQRKQHHRKQHSWLRPHRKTPRRQHPQRLPIKRSCCKRSRAISRIWSETSNSSRRTSSKSPATIQRPSAELKASQEEMKRALAKVSEPSPPKTAQPASPPPTQPRRPCASPSGRLSGRRRERGLDSEGSGSTTTW